MSHSKGEGSEDYDGSLLCSGDCGMQGPATGDGNWLGAGEPMSSIQLSDTSIDWGEGPLCRSVAAWHHAWSGEDHLTLTGNGAEKPAVTG